MFMSKSAVSREHAAFKSCHTSWGIAPFLLKNCVSKISKRSRMRMQRRRVIDASIWECLLMFFDRESQGRAEQLLRVSKATWWRHRSTYWILIWSLMSLGFHHGNRFLLKYLLFNSCSVSWVSGNSDTFYTCPIILYFYTGWSYLQFNFDKNEWRLVELHQ